MKQLILDTCRSIAKKGQYYHVSIYRYGEKEKRQACFDLKNEGKLAQVDSVNKCFVFYRPEDAAVLQAAAQKHQKEMKKIYAQNIIWHEKQIAKDGDNIYDRGQIKHFQELLK